MYIYPNFTFTHQTRQRKFKKCVKNVNLFKFHFYTLDPSKKIRKVGQKCKFVQISLLLPRPVKENSKRASKRKNFQNSTFTPLTCQRKFTKWVKNVIIFQIQLLPQNPYEKIQKVRQKRKIFPNSTFTPQTHQRKFKKCFKTVNFSNQLLHPRPIRENSKSASKT